jgi:exopolysaccharide biosynthesis polyprenyl glycosylphosphotransferase
MVRSRFEFVQFVVDAVLLVLCLYLSSVIRINLPYGMEAPLSIFIMPPALYLIVLVIWGFIFFETNVYWHRYGTKFRYRLLNAVKSHFIACFLYFGVLYLVYRDISRLQSFYFVGLVFVGLVVSRIIIRLVQILFLENEEHKIRVLIVGAGANGLHLKEKIEHNPRTNLHVVGFVPLPFDEPDSTLAPEQVVGAIADLPTLVERERISEVIIIPRWYSSEISAEISRLMFQLQRFPVNVRLAPDYSEISFFQTVSENFEGLPLIGLRTPLFTPMQRVLKRCLDLAIAVPLFLIGFPLYLIVALAIRLESEGPIILKQERIGIHGNPFMMYKFRSMYNNNDQVKFDENKLDIIKRPDDPRVTKVGRLLRRTSLDELPQFLNVILGQMSLVGPRPEMPARLEVYEWWQYKRFEVPQGMTGWWQVNGRANRPMHLNTQDDLYYIENYSLWLDIQILLRTLHVVRTGAGAF